MSENNQRQSEYDVVINDKSQGTVATCTYTLEVWRDFQWSLYYKNSSGDEIANVNFLRRYGTYVLQNTKKRTYFV